jgi:Surfeit locus protein 6
LDPDRGNSAAHKPEETIAAEDGTADNEAGLTRSQIKNRKKKEKKAKEREDKGANGIEDKATNRKTDTKTKESAKVNGVGISNAKPLEDPSTNQPPLHHSKNDPTTLPTTIRFQTNGIKPSPSPSIPSQPHSPPHRVPIISSPAPPDLPTPDSVEDLRARLATRISQARIARKAIGTAVKGAPQTREAILQARARRKAKVEEKIKAKVAASKLVTEVKKEEDESSSEDEVVNTRLVFGKVQLSGTEIDVGKGEVKPTTKSKGPSDAKGRLQHLLAREQRLSGLPAEKAAKAEEQDRWHHALLSTRGEKHRNDIGLLKKTIARKEAGKRKSKREWDARSAAVDKAKNDKQQKREENLAKRRDEKGKKGGKNQKGKKVGGGKGKVIKNKRPGFEGGRVKFGRK